MGFGEAAPLAANVISIEAMVARMRADLARANLIWLCDLSRRHFPGNAALAMMGAGDRDSTLLRQVAIYLGHTALQIQAQHCAASFGLTKKAATRAIQQVEKLRATGDFNLKLELIEAAIAHRLAAQPGRRSAEGLAPPTQPESAT